MKEKLSILIVEDERLYADLLEDMIDELGHQHLGTFRNGEDALAFLNHTSPDLLLLDIQLDGEMDGIELADFIQEKAPVPVVFITSQVDNETYSRAKATAPYAFLEKTSRKRQLQRAIDLVTSRMSPSPTPKQSPQVLLVKVGNTLHKISFEDIVYIQAEDHHCIIFTLDKKYVSRISLKELNQILPKAEFVQVHRSYLVRFEAIESIVPGEGTIQANGGHSIPLGRSFRMGVIEKMKLI